MKVFISWSQERSQKVAELINDLLKCVVQEVDPWISTVGIDSGDVWFSKISRSLADTKVGIVCLTPENKENSWVMFEAGALMKGLEENKVHIVLADLETHEIAPPLSQFNLVKADKPGIFKLINSINHQLSRPLEVNILEKVFNLNWENFDNEYQKIVGTKPKTEKAKPRQQEELLLEILGSVRSFERRLRNVEGGQIALAKKSMVIQKQENIESAYHYLFRTGADPRTVEVRHFLMKNFNLDEEMVSNLIETFFRHKTTFGAENIK